MKFISLNFKNFVDEKDPACYFMFMNDMSTLDMSRENSDCRVRNSAAEEQRLAAAACQRIQQWEGAAWTRAYRKNIFP